MDELRGLWRGKRKDDKQFVKGSLAFNDGKRAAILVNHNTLVCDMSNVEFVEVIPETLGECISKCDKKGKLVFEGDIIKFKEWSNGEWCWIGKVCYEYQQFLVVGPPNKECDCCFTIAMSRLESKRIEVIGNVYDTPELL